MPVANFLLWHENRDIFCIISSNSFFDVQNCVNIGAGGFEWLLVPLCIRAQHIFRALHIAAPSLRQLQRIVWSVQSGGLKRPPPPLDTSIALGKTSGLDQPIHQSIYDGWPSMIGLQSANLSRQYPHLLLGSIWCEQAIQPPKKLFKTTQKAFFLGTLVDSPHRITIVTTCIVSVLYEDSLYSSFYFW